MPQQIGQTFFQCNQIFTRQLLFGQTAVIFQCTHGSHHHRSIRPQTGQPALDVAEFLSTQIRTKPGFGNSIIGQMTSQTRGNN